MDGDAGLIDISGSQLRQKPDITRPAKPACWWCGTGFEPRKGGSPQRFCNSKCRDAFHSESRRFGERAVEGGYLTATDLRNGPGSCMGRPRDDQLTVEPHSVAPGIEEIALTDAQRASARNLSLEVSIAAEGIVDLCTLGWLDPKKLRDASAAADAVAELANAALELRLQPSQ